MRPGFDPAVSPYRVTVDTDDLGLEQRPGITRPHGLVPEIGNREGIDQPGNAREKASIGSQESDMGHDSSKSEIIIRWAIGPLPAPVSKFGVPRVSFSGFRKSRDRIDPSG